jgi:aspartate kinase
LSNNIGYSEINKHICIGALNDNAIALNFDASSQTSCTSTVIASVISLVVSVSAMSGETNRITELAQKIHDTPSLREMDVLLTTGEQVTISLLAMALQQLGCDAISYTGSQVRITTDSAHGKARIKSIDGHRIHTSLNNGKIVVVAGFQGVDEQGNITTLAV